MHLFILCVNLLTCFFVFLSVLSAPHETDGGIYIFHVFLYLVLWKLSSWCTIYDYLLLFLFLWFSNRALSLILYFYDITGTIEQGIMLLTAISASLPP